MSGSNLSGPVSRPSANDEQRAAVKMTVHELPADFDLAQAERTRAGRIKMLVILAICIAPVLVSYLMVFVVQPRGQAYGELIAPARDWPAALTLTDLEGTPVPAASLKGQWLLAVVASGSCDPASCEKALYMQRQLREMLGKEKDRVDKIWLLTDAVTPRPELQKSLTQGDAVRMLRTPAAALDHWLQTPAAASGVQLFVVDPLGRLMMRSPVDPDPMKLKRDLEKLLRASNSWDRAGR